MICRLYLVNVLPFWLLSRSVHGLLDDLRGKIRPLRANENTTSLMVQFGDELLPSVSLQSVGGLVSTRYEFDYTNSIAVTVDKEAKEILNTMLNDGSVTTIETDNLRKPMMNEQLKTLRTNFPEFEARRLQEYNVEIIQALQAHKYTKGRGASICVIDSGIDLEHIELNRDQFKGLNIGSELQWDIDLVSHGTSIAGIISAVHDNAIKAADGIAPEAEVFILRVFDNDSRNFEFASGLIKAVERCAIAGARIVNLSLGGIESNDLEQQGLSKLAKRFDVLIIAASGNYGFTAPPLYPASYDDVISVGAVDEFKERYFGSQAFVDVVAPGVKVLVPKSNTNYNVERKDGTSVACAHVSAVAALLWSWTPCATSSEIKKALFESAEALGSGGGKDDEFGFGLIQAMDALIYLNEGPLDPLYKTSRICAGTVEPTNQPMGSATPTTHPSKSTPETTLRPTTPRPTLEPTMNPTLEPTTKPTTSNPTLEPTTEPTTSKPTPEPSPEPSRKPTLLPTPVPILLPTNFPTSLPTQVPTLRPPTLDCGNRGVCTKHASCIDDFCRCNDGWKADPNLPNNQIEIAGWRSCVDIDECANKDDNICDTNFGTCSNHLPPQKYRCSCKYTVLDETLEVDPHYGPIKCLTQPLGRFWESIISVLPSSGNDIIREGSAQYVSFHWIRENYNSIISAFDDDASLLQLYGLVSLYQSTNSDNWVRSDNWLDISADVGSWYGVMKNTNNQIIELNLSSNNLVGSIPDEVVFLGWINLIDLTDNMLDRVTDKLASLSFLNSLWLHENELTADGIPEEVNKLMVTLQQSYSDMILEKVPMSRSTIYEFGTTQYLSFQTLAYRIENDDIVFREDDLWQRYVLTVLYYSTNGDEWSRKENWGSSDNFCTWNWRGSAKNGVYCNSNNEVYELRLSEKNLRGTIPVELGALSKLTYLSGSNYLTGTIPTEIGKLTSLRWLSLKWNQLTGSIPREIGGLTALTTLYLEGNQLNGYIPREIWGLTTLINLYLSFNQLIGSIPREIGGLRALRALNLSNNRLSGSIPSQFEKLLDLQILKLYDNNLSGNIPEVICANKSYPYFKIDCDKITKCSCCRCE